MYGLVNKAVEELVCGNFGEQKWEEIRQRAGIEEEVFVSNESYPDEVTYRLVGAASEVLAIPATAVLEAFGRHWVLNTARGGYGHLMSASGRTFGEFLQNLPTFHTRIAMMMPRLQPPVFKVTLEKDGENSLRLQYHSNRPGLTSFVVGLLMGLGEMFKVKVDIEVVARKDQGDAYDEFLVRWVDDTGESALRQP